MIFIPGILIAIVTFPGVIVHEAAHMWFCKRRGIPILKTCFFRLGNPVGYVIHGDIEKFNTAFLVCVGPFIINSLLCILICLPTFVPVRVFGQTSFLSYFLLWLGLSIGMHAFPSAGDASNLWYHAKKSASGGNITAILTFPFILAIYAANAARVIWADLFYGLAIGLGLPELVLRFI